MIEQDQPDNSREKENEREDHSDEELDRVIEENVNNEKLLWPGIDDDEMMSISTLVCFCLNFILVPTGYTFLLEQGETRAGLLCHRFLRNRANEILQTIWRAQEAMGSGSSKQENQGETVIEKQVGVDMASSCSLLNLRGWHSSSIGILVMIIIIIIGMLCCARRRYRMLQKEVLLHRGRRLGEKSHSIRMNDSHELTDRIPDVQENETVIKKDALNRLRIAAAGGIE